MRSLLDDSPPALLALADGTVLRGTSIGAAGRTVALVPTVNEPPASSTASPEPHSHPNPSDGSTLRLLGWSLAGAGVALVAVGGVGALTAEPKTNRYNARRSVGLCGGPDESAACRSLFDSARTWRIVNYAGAIGGGVLIVGGLAVALFAPKRPSQAATGTLGPALTCAPTGPGVACSGVF